MEYDPIDLKAIRTKVFKEKQPVFAENIGIKARTYQNYELNGVPISKRPDIYNKVVEYSKLVNITLPEEFISSGEGGEESKGNVSLDAYSDFEIIEYISKNLERFEGLSVFRKVVGLDEVIDLRKQVAELTEIVKKLKS